ncbi:MAG: NADH-quinone oxidoreductase subunit L [Candidatus Omnitrophica bacterium]|nr:NADH-quinone oxidoreductase subunit L [Candidatus Omnitrophota bacterium]
MKNELVLLLIILIPIIGALVLPLISRISAAFRNGFSFAVIAFSFALSFLLLPLALKNQVITIFKDFPLGFNFVFTADSLAVGMAIVVSFISALIVLYSFDYIKHYENQNEYYPMVVLFLGAMMGLVFSGNLILLYVFWEVTAVTSWRLIGFFRKKEHVLAADKAFLVTVFGSLLMLLGFIRMYQETGSFDLFTIREVVKLHPISNLTIALILAGIFSKSATLPFHTWLPDAGVAPSPITALLHAAVLVKIGVYVFARIFIATIPISLSWHTIIPVIAGLSALVSAGAALVDTDLKRIIAYSTISQIGFIFLGFSLSNEIGIAGGLLFILMHGLAKAGLFLCAGIIEQNTKTKDITQLGGLFQAMPVTAVSFLFCAFSVMGIPPFGGFFSKYMIISGTLQKGHLAIAAAFLFGALLTILYLFRAFNLVFLGERKNPSLSVKEGSPLMLICVASFALLSLLGGIFIAFPNQIAQITAQQIMGIK